MEPANWEGSSPSRHQSSIRNILEQVKKGTKNKTEAFTELRSILNSSSGRGLGSSPRADEGNAPVDEDTALVGKLISQSSSQGASRFTQEDRRMLINKLIEKKRRSEEEVPNFAPLTGENLSASEFLHSTYHVDTHHYYSKRDNDRGDDERKWGDGARSSGDSRNNPEDDDKRFTYDNKDKGDDIEDIGTPPPSPPRDSSPHSSISGATRSLGNFHNGNSRNRASSQTRQNNSYQNEDRNNYEYDEDEGEDIIDDNEDEEDGERRYEDERESNRNNNVSNNNNSNENMGRGRRRGTSYYYDALNDEENDGYELNSYDYNRYPQGEMIYTDARSNRMLQNEAMIREEMFRECTFRPKIKELPSTYGIGKDSRGSRDGPFYDRVTRWKEAKEQEALRKKVQAERTNSIDCTFHPRMNRNSERAMKEIRGGRYSAPSVGERLHKNSEAVYMMRARAIEEELERERNHEESSCTFQPTLIESGRFSNVKSRFHIPTERTDYRHLQERFNKNCTFTPKVKGISPSMTSAQLYVRTDVVERLTRTAPPTPIRPTQDGNRGGFEEEEGETDGDRDRDRDALDMRQNVGTGYHTPYGVGGRGAGQTNTQSNSQKEEQREGEGSTGSSGSRTNNTANSHSSSERQGGRDRSSSRRRSASASGPRRGYPSSDVKYEYGQKTNESVPLSAEEVRERELRFQQFLGRQQQSALKNQQHLKTLVSSSTPKFQPALCRKSLAMSDQHFKGEFLDRVERDVLRRCDSENRLLASGKKDFGCTFHPTILGKSEKLRGRSSYEMSRGDLLRRETSQRMMKLRLEREELTEYTFQPEISHLARNTESALRLKENPSFFLEYHKSTQARREELKERERQMREEKELELCTFAPVTIDCPSYVKRIAMSMAAVKAAAVGQNKGSPSDRTADKPMWK